MIDLLIEDERGNVITHQLGDGKHTLGKAADSDIVLMDEFASRHHADLVIAKEAVFIIDAGSKNGILFNHHRIKKNMKLAIGQEFTIGNLKLTVKKSLFKLFVKAGRKIFDDKPEIDESKFRTIDEKVTALLQY